MLCFYRCLSFCQQRGGGLPSEGVLPSEGRGMPSWGVPKYADPLREQTPLSEGRPPLLEGRSPPPWGREPGNTINAREVRILLESILVCMYVFAHEKS